MSIADQQLGEWRAKAEKERSADCVARPARFHCGLNIQIAAGSPEDALTAT